MQAAAAPAAGGGDPQRPVLLLDVMDTLVTDPFFEHMPRFFRWGAACGWAPPRSRVLQQRCHAAAPLTHLARPCSRCRRQPQLQRAAGR